MTPVLVLRQRRVSRAVNHFLLSPTRPTRRVTVMFLIYGRGASRKCSSLEPHGASAAIGYWGALVSWNINTKHAHLQRRIPCSRYFAGHEKLAHRSLAFPTCMCALLPC